MGLNESLLMILTIMNVMRMLGIGSGYVGDRQWVVEEKEWTGVY